MRNHQEAGTQFSISGCMAPHAASSRTGPRIRRTGAGESDCTSSRVAATSALLSVVCRVPPSPLQTIEQVWLLPPSFPQLG